MTGVTVTATIRDEEILERLQGLVARMSRPEGFHKTVGEHMLRSVRSNFEEERAPDGTAWSPLRPSTVRKRGSAGPILTLKGYLRGSINHRATAQAATIGTGAVHAAIHQLGGRIEKAARRGVVRFAYDPRTGEIGTRFARRRSRHVEQEVSIGAHAIDIPARPFLGVSKADEAAILRLAERWILLGDG